MRTIRESLIFHRSKLKRNRASNTHSLSTAHRGEQRPLFTAFFILIFLSIAQTSQAQATRRPLVPADIVRVSAVADAQISPDGEWVVYTVSTLYGNTARTTLWIVRADQPTAITTTARSPLETERTEITRTNAPLLQGDWNASSPRWSPDSRRLAFLSNKDGQSGIWTVSLADRRPRLVASLRETNFFITYAGEPFAWSPDSRRIAFINASEDESASVDSDDKNNDPRVINRIQYKSRTSFSDHLRTHVWVTDVDRPDPHQLTAGPFYDHALTWSPRGDEVAFLSNHEQDPDAVNNSDIFAVDMSGRLRQLTHTAGCEYEPAWSPDGRWIAYTATKRDVTTIDSVAEDTHLWAIEAGGGQGRELTAAQDRRARSPRWSSDSRSIYFLAGDHGRIPIFRVNVESGETRPAIDANISAEQRTALSPLRLPRSFQVTSFSVGKGTALFGDPKGTRAVEVSSARLAFSMSDAVHPAEIWLDGLNALSPAHRVSAHNDALISSTALSEPEEINFNSFDGTRIQGWLMKPVGFREDRRYPLILSIHGGPHGMFGYSFNAAFQVYAARGYAVLFINPRGSIGYGQKFSDGTLREWGGGDYRDLMAGVDEVLRTRSWIDPDRLGVTGASYGGFMTNWIITQTTRFRAAMAQASVSNLISFYSTSLYQDLVHAEFGGFPWDDYDLLWRWSPLRYVKQAQTPTLFIHGEQDNDVHITQAEEMYMALRRRGIETEFVRYPREGHGLREPLHRIDALERTLAWFDKYLK